MANTVQPVSLAESVASILVKAMVCKICTDFITCVLHFSLFAYLEKENRNTKIYKYLCGLLHFLEVHNMEDDDDKHHHHRGGTGNGARGKPFLFIIVLINC